MKLKICNQEFIQRETSYYNQIIVEMWIDYAYMLNSLHEQFSFTQSNLRRISVF